MMCGRRGVLSTPCIVISSKGVLSTPLQTRGKYQVGWEYLSNGKNDKGILKGKV